MKMKYTYSPYCVYFGFLKKSTLFSGTVLMIQLMQNSPTCAYISQNQHKWKPHHWQPHYAGTSCPVLHFHNSFMFIILSKIEQKFSCVAKSVKFVDKSVPFDPCPKSLGPVQKHCTYSRVPNKRTGRLLEKPIRTY